MLRCVFFLCLSVAVAGLGCNWLDHFSQRTYACLKQLQQMGAGADLTKDVTFPNQLYNRIRCQNVDSQLAFVQESLQHIFRLYRHGNRSCVGWDVEHFLSTLHSQASRLRPCVSTNQKENLDLSKYYRRLLNITVRNNGSLASWQKINHITQIHLHRLNSLVLSIRSPTTRDVNGREKAPECITSKTALERRLAREPAEEHTTSRRTALERPTNRTAPEHTTSKRTEPKMHQLKVLQS